MKLASANFSDRLEPNIEIKGFPDGDQYVNIPDIKKIKGKKVEVYHRLYPEQDKKIIQAVFLLKTLKENGCRVDLVAPYLPYSRQDKRWKKGEPLSAEYICSLLKWAGAEKLTTFDCHFLKKTGEHFYGGLKIKNVSLSNPLIEYAEKKYGKLEVITPDMGAGYMVQGKGKSMKKERGEYLEGKEAYREIKKLEMDFDVKGKNILIIDDMISSGSTMIKAVENLKSGGAEKIICCATHGFFLKDSLKKLSGICEEVYVSNTIPTEVSKINFMDYL
ncbi:ribose-phosphate diphosphokinase [Candidatus Micrarchaeota archaeon]|nr:ribose-phosphate diphosphokinase [Candidatus Micrarchaeota archaeon]